MAGLTDPKDGFEIAFKQFPESQMLHLYNQRQDGRFCDAVINCEDGDFKAHRCILATFCAKDTSKPVVLPQKSEAVKRLVNMCYTGYLRVLIDNLDQDLKVARALECEFVVNSIQRWIMENVKQVSSSEKLLKDIDFETLSGCVDKIKYMNETWLEFFNLWAGTDAARQKDLATLQARLEKFCFVSNFRFALVGGRVMKFDGSGIVDENWNIPPHDRVLIVDNKSRKRINIAREGTMTVYAGDQVIMTHPLRLNGVCESVRPMILWLSDGSLLKLVDKANPFEELSSEEKELYQGAAWKKPPIEQSCGDLYILPEIGVIIHYPGHGTCYMASRAAQGFQSWAGMPCSDIHHAFADGRKAALVTRDVNTYTIVASDTFQTTSTVIRGNPCQSPFAIPSFCHGGRIVVAIVDLERNPKTFYFVQYEDGRSRVLSELFEATNETQFSVM